MSEKKNLKEGSDKLLYYRSRSTGNRIPKMKNTHGKPVPYYVEELERIYFEEDDVRKFSLDKHGQSIPYVDGQVTLINNYLFDYWGHFLSAEGIALFSHLKRFCYGEKDFCWPNLELISLKMNKSRNTVKKYLGVLEDYGFVYAFNVQNANNNNTDESLIFKIRKKVPLLSQKLFAELPQVLQLDHDRYIQKIMATCDQEIELDPDVDYSELYSALSDRGRIHHKPKQLTFFEIEQQNRIKKQLLLGEVTADDADRWNKFLDIMQKRLSRPSFDNWFKTTFAIKKSDTYTIYSPNDFVTDWLRGHYYGQITEILRTIDSDFTHIEVETV